MAARATVTVVSASIDTSSVSQLEAITSNSVVESIAYIDSTSDNQWFYQETLLSDIRFNIFEKNTSDSYSLPDKSVKALDKASADSFGLLQEFARTVVYNRSFTDSFTLDDLSSINKKYFGNKGNVTFITDIIGMAYEKNFLDPNPLGLGVLGDSVLNGTVEGSEELRVLVIDHMDRVLEKVLSDSYNLAELMSLGFTKNYSGDSYSILDANSKHFNKNSNDPVSFSDTDSFILNKAIIDGIGLDDSTLVNKNFYGSKGNIFGFSDEVVVDLILSNTLNSRTLNTMSLN